MGAFKLEPTLILQGISAAWNAAQFVALPMKPWEHAVVLGVSSLLATIANRAAVTPNAKVAAIVPAVAPEPWTAGP